MSSDDKTVLNTLNDHDIKTRPRTGRRRVLGLLAIGGLSATVAGAARAQTSTDRDTGHWNDDAGCGRGAGGVFTGSTDADNGEISDRANYGRGMPYC